MKDSFILLFVVATVLFSYGYYVQAKELKETKEMLWDYEKRFQEYKKNIMYFKCMI